MTSSSSTFKSCVLCLEENQLKPKLGIHPCHGCQSAFCLVHLTKHRQDLAQKLDTVITQRDEFFETMFNSFNITNENMEKSLKDIDQWEIKMQTIVHENAEKTRNNLQLEYLTHFNDIKGRYDQFTKELTEKRENDDFFEDDIENLSARLERFKQEIHQININIEFNHVSDPIDMNQARNPAISYLTSSQLLCDRQMISLRDRNCFFLAASDTHILAYILSINRNENRLVFYNISDGQELRSTELDVRLGNVCDMIYAPTLNRCFLVVCRKAILLYDSQQMNITIMPEIQPIDEHPFWSIAVGSNTNDAFISLDSNGYIERWSTEIHPIWKLIKRWNIDDILQTTDQGIRMIRVCIKTNQLAVMVLQKDHYWRIDVFDFDMQLIYHGRILTILNDVEKSSFGCRLLLLSNENDQTWLISERSTRSLWLMNSFILKQIDKNVHSVCLISNNQQQKIAVSYNNEPKRIEIFNL
ncbi:hypothetical protein I4U23_001341 [Adineta vaga]|nr:hypothetical protein I4U23_001341 [Adineta vaga]